MERITFDLNILNSAVWTWRPLPHARICRGNERPTSDDGTRVMLTDGDVDVEAVLKLDRESDTWLALPIWRTQQFVGADPSGVPRDCCDRCGGGHPYHCTRVTFTDGSEHGAGALCESCWQQLTPQERLPHYRRLYAVWTQEGADPEDWERLRAAVLEARTETPLPGGILKS
ncbi:MAG: hypothetical protein M1358_00585 [Chloroflexi bacterium]|nr:hypothetical protein [Chloroflexota bacterium]